MLQFKQDDTSASLILTLSEFVTLNDPYFLFVFTHVTTKETVSFIKSSDDDLSNYPERFNEFTINPSVLFLNKQVGQWHYKVYEQTSDTNLDTSATTGILEYGKLILDRATDFSYNTYESGTTFKTYNG